LPYEGLVVDQAVEQLHDQQVTHPSGVKSPADVGVAAPN
jgi:hypothetical protein